MLKIQSDRVIIDGHEPTKEQCETMTLLANALAESESFKTVKYESGYAEFEKVVKAEELKFVPAPPQDVTVIFDSHIISVNCPSSGKYGGGSWTTSGETVNGMYDVGLTYYVELEDGYVIDTVVISGTEPFDPPVISDDGKSFYGQLTTGDSFTITITSKSTVSRKSVDLTTLPGWSSLSSGSHSITIVAKADGYRDSEPSAAVSVTKGAAMPVKGDIITIESKQYRVLNVSGSVAEVLCMYDASSSLVFDTNSSYNNTYAGKNIDTCCNNTFYDGLSAAIKSAIVDKTFAQDSWFRQSSAPSGSYYTGKSSSSTYYLIFKNAAYGTSITRHCYVLSVQDVLDYLDATTSMGTSDTTLKYTNIWKMFWNTTSSQSGKNIWLRSADSSSSNYVFNIFGQRGSFDYNRVDRNYAVRPAFQIDLSKVEFTK